MVYVYSLPSLSLSQVDMHILNSVCIGSTSSHVLLPPQILTNVLWDNTIVIPVVAHVPTPLVVLSASVLLVLLEME